MIRIMTGFLTLVLSSASCGGSVQPGGGGSAGTGGAGGSAGSGTVDPADVYLTSTIGPSSKSQPCQIGTVTPELQIGSDTSGVQTGTQGTTVTCSVMSSGSGFAVSAEVDAEGGSFAVSGAMPSSGTGSGITASLDYGVGGGAPVLYSGTNCSVTLANASTPGFDPSAGPPIAPGRVWATLDCPDMTVAGQTGVCEGVVTFRLENCAGSP
jgi:hypothetical protein